MSLTTRQIQLVQHSASAIDDVLERFAAAFYARLFGTYPSLRPLFPEDTEEQARKLAVELRRIVSALESPERFERQVSRLGARHARYGAEPAHYDAVGAVLLDTLAEQLGGAFTSELHDAWATAYVTIAALMLDAQVRSYMAVAD